MVLNRKKNKKLNKIIIKFTLQLSYLIMSTPPPDFLNDKAAREEFLKKTLDRLHVDLNPQSAVSPRHVLVRIYPVASDTANVQFLLERGRINNGSSYYGVQIHIKKNRQIPRNRLSQLNLFS